MKDDKFFWDYEKEPGILLKNNYKKDIKTKPLVSIVTSYYNSNEYMWQTINCVLNQTFEAWEWIIVDDGSTNKEAIKYLNEVEKIDTRITIYRKENEGLAKGRDYAIEHTSNTKYILPLDADDLIEPTYIETLYWTLETNTEASWAFTNSVGFGKYLYLSDSEFDSERMKIDNHITATALIRKEKIQQVGGYGKAKRYVNEDWHLWLRMLAQNMYPVQVGFYGFWYRRRKDSLLSEINDDNRKEYKLKERDLKIEADKITKKIKAINYPQNEEILELTYNNINKIETIKDENNNKKRDLYILPYLGTDKKIYKKIKKASKERNIYVITMQQTKHSSYIYRQKYEEFCTIYDLTTFLNEKYWLSFIEYIINNKNVENTYISNTRYNEQITNRFSTIKIKKCKDSIVIYNIKKIQYYVSNSLIIRGFKKIWRYIKNRKDR